MRRLSIGKVIATGTLACALTLVLQLPATSAPETSQAPAKHDPHYTPPPTPAVRDLILSIDQNIFVSWQKGDVKKLDSLLDWNAKFVDGTATGAEQLLDKEQFLARVKSVRLPKTLVASERTLHMAGGEPSDVAYVTGVLKDSGNPADSGAAYVAVYLRSYLLAADSEDPEPKAWVLVHYQTSPRDGKSPQNATSPAAVPWSLDDLSPSQKRVVDVIIRHFDSTLRKDADARAKTVNDDFAEVNAFSQPDGSAPAHLIGLGAPDIKILGVYSQTAVVTFVAREALGGVIFGADEFKPQWRSTVYDTYVLVRPHSDWLIAHHQATAVSP